MFSFFLFGLIYGDYKNRDNIVEPATPSITYGEFPFTVSFEVDNKIYTIEDTVICNYEGPSKLDMVNNGYLYHQYIKYPETPKYRVWSYDYKDHETPLILYELSDEIYFQLSLSYSAEYLMGDYESSSYNCAKTCSIVVVKKRENGVTYLPTIPAEEIYEEYGIRIISFEIAPPIENTFTEVN